MWKRPLLFLLLKIKGNKRRSNFYFVFVSSPVGPTFDLETKKKVRVSEYALSDSGNRFS